MSKKSAATKLRLRGKSYGEIMKALNISSKGTLSYWFRDLELSDSAKRRLQHNVELAYRRGLFAFNKKRTESILAENKSIFKQACSEISTPSNKELRLIGAALYWAEGTKRDSSKRYPTVSFANSDPKMVSVFMRYLRDVLQIKNDKIRPGIIIHPNIDAERAKDFWIQVTKLPKDHFWVCVAVSSASKGKRPAHRLPYGTLQLRVHNRQLFYKIQGHIAGIEKRLQ